MLFRFILILLFATSIYSYPRRDARGHYSENFLHMQGKASIKVQDHYFSPGDNIFIDFKIHNFGNEPIRVFPTMAEYETYQFIIKDEDDRVLPLRDTVKLVSARNRQQPDRYSYSQHHTFFKGEQYSIIPGYKNGKTIDQVQERRNRSVNLSGDPVKEVIIHPGESFSRKINLSDLYQFEPGKKYFITGYFYPNYFENKQALLKSSNQASFSIHSVSKRINPIRFPRRSSLGVAGVTPEEIIFLFLGAERKRNWQRYFHYIHFPDYIMAYTRYAEEYTKAKAVDRQAIIDEFKEYLSQSNHGKLIYYRILSSHKINDNTSQVNVFVERELGRIKQKYEYQYTLKKINRMPPGFWKITNLVVKVRR